jgi:hypothetical protein
VWRFSLDVRLLEIPSHQEWICCLCVLSPYKLPGDAQQRALAIPVPVATRERSKLPMRRPGSIHPRDPKPAITSEGSVSEASEVDIIARCGCAASLVAWEFRSLRRHSDQLPDAQPGLSDWTSGDLKSHCERSSERRSDDFEWRHNRNTATKEESESSSAISRGEDDHARLQSKFWRYKKWAIGM